MTTEHSEPKAIGATDRDLEPGQQVGDYVIESRIGQGGFGTVFKAMHPLIGKLVAIKVLNRQYSAQPEMVSRFVAEARAVNQIRHRFIIDIFGFGQLDDGRHYYVMEYLDGQSLDDYLERRGALPLADAIPILTAIARALDAAHEKGIAHRDLKPENVFLATDSDGGLYPKLLDFGIAKLLVADDQLKHKTRTGAPIGTPYYMSPEQCRGRNVDHRTDVYAFGCLTYRMLTGVVPFDAEDALEILFKQLNDPVPSARAHAPGLPASVDAAIGWMMAKEPAERPASLGAAVQALSAVAPVPVAPVAAPPRRRVTLVAAAGLAVLAGIVALAVLQWSGDGDPPAPRGTAVDSPRPPEPPPGTAPAAARIGPAPVPVTEPVPEPEATPEPPVDTPPATGPSRPGSGKRARKPGGRPTRNKPASAGDDKPPGGDDSNAILKPTF